MNTTLPIVMGGLIVILAVLNIWFHFKLKRQAKERRAVLNRQAESRRQSGDSGDSGMIISGSDSDNRSDHNHRPLDALSGGNGASGDGVSSGGDAGGGGDGGGGGGGD